MNNEVLLDEVYLPTGQTLKIFAKKEGEKTIVKSMEIATDRLRSTFFERFVWLSIMFIIGFMLGNYQL